VALCLIACLAPGIVACGNLVTAVPVGKMAISLDDNGDVLAHVVVCDAAVTRIYAIDEDIRNALAQDPRRPPENIGEITFSEPKRGVFTVNLSTATQDNEGQTIRFPQDPQELFWVTPVVTDEGLWTKAWGGGYISDITATREELASYPTNTLLTRSREIRERTKYLRQLDPEELATICEELGRTDDS
jgi:hypothetical protein